MPFNLKIYSENFEDYTDRPAEFKWTDPSVTIDTNDYPTMFREKSGNTLSIKSIKIEDLEIKNKVYSIRSYSNANGADSNLFYSKTSRSQSTKMEAFSPYFEIQSGDSISFDVRNLDVDSDLNLLGRSYKANIKIELNSENGTDEQVLATYSGIERSFIPFKANATVAGKYRLKITAYTEAYEFGDISNVTDADAKISIDDVTISRGSTIELNKESLSEGDDFSVIIRPPLPSVGEQLYYKITGADKYDILSNQISGKTLVGSNNTALINISTVKDLKTEGKEQWKLLLYEDPEFTKSIAEPIVINILDTSTTPSFEKGYSYQSEGSDIQLTITSSEYDVGSKLYYALSGNNVTESDFDSKKLTGDVTLQKDAVKLLIKLSNDLLTEGDENVKLIFYSDADKSNEITHPYYSEYSTKTFTIYDTSKSPPSFKIATSASRINEGDELKTIISVKDFEGRIYWSISGKGISEKDFAQGSLRNDGYVTESDNYVISHTLKSDQVTEGEEQIEIKLFSDYNRTVQLGETSVVIINDTSLPRETILPEQIQDGFLDLDNGEDPILMWKGKFLNIDDVKDWSKVIFSKIRNADTGQIIDLLVDNIHVAQDGSFIFGIDLENASSGDWDFSEFHIAGKGYWDPQYYTKYYPTEKNKFDEEKQVGLSELANNLELGFPKFKVQNKNADMVAPTIKSYKLPSQLNDGILDIDAGESPQLVYEFSIEDPFTDTNRASGFSKINLGFQDSFYNDASFEFDASIGVVKATIDSTYLNSGAYKLERFGIEDIEGNSYQYVSDGTNPYYTRDEYYNSKKDLTKEEFMRLSGIDPEAGPFKFTVKNTNPPKDLPTNANGKLDRRVESLSLPTQFSDGIIDLDGGESPNLELKIKLTDVEGQDGISVPQFYFTNKKTSKQISLFGDPVSTLPTDLVLSADVSWLASGEYFLSSLSLFDTKDDDFFYYNRSKDDKELDIKAKQDMFQQETGIDLSSGNFDFSVKNSKIDSRSPVIKLEPFSIPNQFTSGEALEIPISGLITDLNLDGTAGSGLKNFWISYSLEENYFPGRSFTVTQADLDLKGAFLKPFYLSDLQPGKWSLFYFGLIDNAGNEDSYYINQSHLDRQSRLNDKLQFQAKTGIDIDQFHSFLVTSPIQNQGPATFAVSGTVQVGQVLTVAKTADDPDGNGTFSYQWQSSTDGNTWSNIGTNADSYTLTSAEQAKQIRVQVSYTDAQAFTEAITIPAGTVAAVNDGVATFAVSGTVQVGQVLTVAKTADDPDGNGTFSYQWQSSTDGNTWSNIGTNADSYTLTSAEQAKQIRVQISYTDAQYYKEMVVVPAGTVSDSTVSAINDGAATHSIFAGNGGTAVYIVGQRLLVEKTATDPDGGHGIRKYQWQSSTDGNTWSNIGIDNEFYALTVAEQAKQIRVQISYTDGEGFQENITVAGGYVPIVKEPIISITGNYIPSSTLTANVQLDPNSPYINSTFTYTWYANKEIIAAQTTKTLILTDDLVGKRISVTASFTNSAGQSTSVTTAENQVQAGFTNSKGIEVKADVRLENANLDGGFTTINATTNPNAKKAVDALKANKVELSSTMVNFTIALPSNPTKPAENQTSASIAIGIDLVSDGIALSTGTGAASKQTPLSYYSVDSAGVASPFTYDPVSKTGANFYDTNSDGTPDLVTLAFVDGGRGDKDGIKNGKIVDPSTAATVNVSAVLANFKDSLLIADPLSDAPAALIVKTKLISRAATVNEIGYVVLDKGETIDSIGFAGLKSRAQILFAGLESSDIPNLSSFSFDKSIALINGQSIRFFETTDSSLKELAAGKSSVAGLGSSFKFLSTTIDSSTTKATAASSSGINFSLEIAGSFAGLDSLIGVNQADLPILDFSALAGIEVTADLSLAREASYNSSIGFYKILAIDGSVRDPISGNVFLPGDSGYKNAALSNKVTNLKDLSIGNLQNTTNEIKINESGMLAPYAIVSGADTYFAYAAANADLISHFKVLGTNIIGLEDLYGGGDKDFDDVVIGIKARISFAPL